MSPATEGGARGAATSGELLPRTWWEAWGCHWSCWQGQSGTNELEPGACWAALGLSVITSDHCSFLRMGNSLLFHLPNLTQPYIWPTLTQNPTEKEILGNSGSPIPGQANRAQSSTDGDSRNSIRE